MHMPCPALAAYFPCSHLVQFVLPSGEKWPTAHASHAFRSGSGLCVPALQLVGSDAPTEHHVAGGQMRHSSKLLIAEAPKRPAGHGSGADERFTHTLPTGQPLQAVELSVPVNVPPKQAVHWEAPKSAAKVPGAHGLGSVELVEHALPGGHGVHSVADSRLVALLYEPPLHATGTEAPGEQ